MAIEDIKYLEKVLNWHEFCRTHKRFTKALKVVVEEAKQFESEQSKANEEKEKTDHDEKS